MPHVQNLRLNENEGLIFARNRQILTFRSTRGRHLTLIREGWFLFVNTL